MKAKKPKWITRKYMGDCPNSWAIIDRNYLPKGHRGPIFQRLPDYAVSYTGLNNMNKSYYLKLAKEKRK